MRIHAAPAKAKERLRYVALVVWAPGLEWGEGFLVSGMEGLGVGMHGGLAWMSQGLLCR